MGLRQAEDLTSYLAHVQAATTGVGIDGYVQEGLLDRIDVITTQVQQEKSQEAKIGEVAEPRSEQDGHGTNIYQSGRGAHLAMVPSGGVALWGTPKLYMVHIDVPLYLGTWYHGGCST